MLNRTSHDDLRRTAIFREMTEDELRYLSRLMDERDYKKGELIYQEDEVPHLMYIVLEGAVEITKKTPSGHRQVLAMIEAGQFFGELSFFENRRHAARARASEATCLVLLNKSAYNEAEKDRPLLVHKLLREIIMVISNKLDSMNDLFLQMIHYAFYGGKAGKVEMPGQED